MAPMWWMRTRGGPASAPPARPPLARNSSTVLRSNSVTADPVDQAQSTVRQLPDLAQFELAAHRRRHEERLFSACDQGIDDQPYLVHQPGVDRGGRDRSAAH